MSSKTTFKRKQPVEKPGPDEAVTCLAHQPKKAVPVELQQLLLNIFKNGFPAYYDSKLPVLVQQVKQHLYNRDFNAAFGEDNLRSAYAARWSPSRALAYTHIFANLPPLTMRLLSTLQDRPDEYEGGTDDRPTAATHGHSPCQQESANIHDFKGNEARVVCIGAGAGAELVALGGYIKHLIGLAPADERGGQDESLYQEPPPICLSITAIDIADWKDIIQTLHSGLTVAPQISQYASLEAKATNTPLVKSDTLEFNFLKQDVLNMVIEEMGAVFTDAKLVTLMFTLNELYATSIGATTNLLLSLTMLLEPGALLLVVDSPGSYSTVKIGKYSTANNETNEKKYPMQWLLDHTLLEASAVGSSKKASGEQQWEKLESRHSEWFRLSNELRYPIDLEGMRYQVHLYRRI